AVVEKRTDARAYQAVPTIGRFGEKIAAAAGMSSNYELVVKQKKLGGNGPIMANALASFGLDVTYVGNLGYPDLDPVFSEFARRADVRSIAPAAHTDALEFGDGKLMLGKMEPLYEVTWENITSRLGPETFERLVGRSRLIAMVNWTMLPEMSRIWAKLLKDVLPELPETQQGNAAGRHVFIDLADPEKRTRDDLRYALKLCGKMQEMCEVTLGLNLKESQQAADVLGLPAPTDPEASIEDTAAAIREALDIACCVVHPRFAAAAATKDDRATFGGPYVQTPKISTGAGDHFNAGFMLGRILDRPTVECLCVGVATSGHYVRTGESPSAAVLADFISELPDPEPVG
ncbi:MAG: hypothetical protein AAGK78_02660, partial [Planctomycetota bacterium]